MLCPVSLFNINAITFPAQAADAARRDCEPRQTRLQLSTLSLCPACSLLCVSNPGLQLPLTLLEVMVPSRSMTRSNCCVTRTDFYHLLCYHHPLTTVRCAPVLPVRLSCQEAGVVSCCSVCPGIGWHREGVSVSHVPVDERLWQRSLEGGLLSQAQELTRDLSRRTDLWPRGCSFGLKGDTHHFCLFVMCDICNLFLES